MEELLARRILLHHEVFITKFVTTSFISRNRREEIQPNLNTNCDQNGFEPFTSCDQIGIVSG